MRNAISLLCRLVGVPERTESPDWWTYFGSFGDDVFGDAVFGDAVVGDARDTADA